MRIMFTLIGFYFKLFQGKKVTCKKAEARQGKIYVGKLPPGDALSKEDITTQFGEYGEVVRPVDKMKDNEPKTFAFITFAREDTAKQLVKMGEVTIGGHTVEIKRVTPKDQGNAGGWGGNMGWGGYSDPYGYGGYGGGYGDPYGQYGGYGAPGWGGPGFGGGAGGKMRGGPAGGRGGGRGRGRGRPYQGGESLQNNLKIELKCC